MSTLQAGCEGLDALPLHGGDVAAAAKRFNVPESEWIDLSTGMNPFAYPVSGIPESAFTQLPYLQQEFLQAAERYYYQGSGHQSSSFQSSGFQKSGFQSSGFQNADPQASNDQKKSLAVAGTQAAIQLLPSLLYDVGEASSSPITSVLLPAVGYSEHRASWQKHALGHQGVQHQDIGLKNIERSNKLTLNTYSSLSLAETIHSIDAALNQNPYQHLVVINPNNPTGVVLEKHQLLEWANRLGEGAYLIIDEAFMDADCAELTCHHASADTASNRSLLTESSLPDNIIVLRSFGKFFGLAGIRVGFVFAHSTILKTLQEQSGLWQINGPAQYIATQAFNDTEWQKQTLKRLQMHNVAAQPLLSVLHSHDTQAHAPNLLFTTYRMPLKRAIRLYQYLARQGILTRVIPLESVRLNSKRLNSKALAPRSPETLGPEAKGLLRIGVFDTQNAALYARLQDAFNKAVADVN